MSSYLEIACGKAIDAIEIEPALILSTMITVVVHDRVREGVFVIKTLLLPAGIDLLGFAVAAAASKINYLLSL